MALDIVILTYDEQKAVNQQIQANLREDNLDVVMAAADDYDANPYLLTDPPFPAATISQRCPSCNFSIFLVTGECGRSFSYHFEVTIICNLALPRNQQFKYLLCYLTSKAKSVVKIIRRVPANYNTALKNLTARFGQTDMLSENPIDSMLE